MESMAPFIATAVERACDEHGVEAGRAKYCAYFKGATRQRLYGRFQDEVDTILAVDGYENCIVDC